MSASADLPLTEAMARHWCVAAWGGVAEAQAEEEDTAGAAWSSEGGGSATPDAAAGEGLGTSLPEGSSLGFAQTPQVFASHNTMDGANGGGGAPTRRLSAESALRQQSQTSGRT